MTMIDVPGGQSQSTKTPSRQRNRRDWVRGEVHCLNCGRLLGRLLGTPRRRDDGDRSAGQPVSFLAYRPLDPVGNVVRFKPGMRFRCRSCGGAGALDDIDVFSTYDEAPIDPRSEDEDDDEPVVRGPGRPARDVRLQAYSAVSAVLETF
jgi:hypothetical protein